MDIRVIRAREHNLKNIDVSIPRNQLVVITGVSGSGKSTLAFDVIFAEAQREYLESLSTYSRQTLPKFTRANVDAVEGLSPCLVIDQRPLARNPRSTVGTVTEVYTFLRLLFSRLGKPTLNAGDFSFNTPSGACEVCGGLGLEFVPDLDKLIDWDKSLAEGAILHRNWEVGSRNWNIINALGIFDMNKPLNKFSQEELETLLNSEPRAFQNRSPGYIQNFTFEGIISRIMRGRKDSRGLEGNSYSDQFFSLQTCRECKGARVNSRARAVRLNGYSIVDLSTIEITKLLAFVRDLKGAVAEAAAPYMIKVLERLVDLGLGYLTLSRSVDTLSGGESQKVKLSRQIGNSLTELIYILDEPTVGLHPRDVEGIVRILRQLVQKPNTVITVEHDLSVMRNADYIIDLGPGPGIHGGKVIATGSPPELMISESITGRYLSYKAIIPIKENRRWSDDHLVVKNARLHNLKNLNVKFVRYAFNCLTGVSGSGKSSLIEVLLKQYPKTNVVDQTPVGSNPNSIPATYVDAFGRIRQLFSKATGKSDSMFSFNSKGACPNCNGLGYEKTDLHFLGEIRQICSVCQGRRYSDDVLECKYKGKNIADVLEMTITEALAFFDDSFIKNKLQVLHDVGLGYLRLGQPLDTLSGGEAQRVKMASHLSNKGNVYVLDEPTRGLHPSDINRLLMVLEKLVERGNTVIVVEHDLDVIKNADWVIDLGPESGDRGGEIVAEGPPEVIARSPVSHTGRYLAEMLQPSNANP